MQQVKRGLGCIKSPTDPRDYAVPAGTAEGLPKAYSSIPAQGYQVKDQGMVNSCVAHALCTAVEIMAQNTKARRSDGFVYHHRDWCDYKGAGMYVRDALKTAQKAGVCLWSDYKENVEVPKGYDVFKPQKQTLLPKAARCKIGSYYAIPIYENPRYGACPLGMLDIAATKRAVYQNGFALVCYYVFAQAYALTARDPVLAYPDKAQTPDGAHCVLITGWTEDGNWEIVNSWGEGYADKGIFYAPLDYPFHEAWTFDSVQIRTPTYHDGWYKQDDDWHYRKDGMDCIGWVKVGGNWYYMQTDGVMLTGWLHYDGEWYWLDNNGTMAQTCWRLIDGRWYSFGKNGAARKGYHNIGGKGYYFAHKTQGPLKECQLITTDKDGVIQ